MSGSENQDDTLYVLDDNSISKIWLSYYRRIFVGFWERFDELLRSGGAVSVSAVRGEMEHRRVFGAVAYLERIQPGFFAEPTPAEQSLIREMFNDPGLSAAANRWRSKMNADADPYLIAKIVRSTGPAAVVTEESQDPGRTGSIPYVCRYMNVTGINLEQMMTRLGWQF